MTLRITHHRRRAEPKLSGERLDRIVKELKRGWGYYPSGGLGLIVLILIILLLMGRL